MAKFLTNNFSVRSWETSTEWWIGALRERSSKRKWRWVDGDKVSKDIAYVWDKKGQDTDEHCLSIHRVPKWPEAGFSSDRSALSLLLASLVFVFIVFFIFTFVFHTFISSVHVTL